MRASPAAAGGIAAGVLTWVLVGGWAGALAAPVVAIAAGRGLRRMEPPSAQALRERLGTDLPFVADLLAAALRAGAPTEHAVRAVGASVGGAAGRQLITVADGLRLGLAPADAWSALHGAPAAPGLATAVLSGADTGAAVAAALERYADGLRTGGVVRVEASARRLGVLMVLPLGLCFLPAFVLAGVVPVIVAVLGGVLR